MALCAGYLAWGLWQAGSRFTCPGAGIRRIFYKVVSTLAGVRPGAEGRGAPLSLGLAQPCFATRQSSLTSQLVGLGCPLVRGAGVLPLSQLPGYGISTGLAGWGASERDAVCVRVL